MEDTARRAVFVPVTGIISGIAAVSLASGERLKQRIDGQEKRVGQSE